MTLTSAVLSGGALSGRMSGLPDVIVAAVRWSEDDGQSWHQGSIAAGSNVLFQADVQNVGPGPTPSGVIIGVAFSTSTGGAFTLRSWSDTHTSSLGSGQTVTLTANGGPDADKYWNSASGGTYTVRANVDDINRFLEDNESNNILDVPNVTVVGGLTAPAQAAAQGYTELVFQEEFDDTSGIDMADSRQPGFNFYRFKPFGFGVLSTDEISISNSVLTLNQPISGSDANYGMGSTCGIGNQQWIGFEQRSGGYFEASIAFGPPGASPGGWPAFWSMANEHLWGGDAGQSGWIESDFFDKFHTDSRYLTGGHWWLNPSTPQSSVFTPNPVGLDYSQFHIFGSLWVPGNRWEGYRDNVSTGPHLFSTYPFLSNGDTQGWPVILGTGTAWPMQVDWVRVWAAP
jgi:CARDB